MSVRLGFLRIELLYYRRWWLIIGAVPVIFAYRTLSQPAPVDVDPATWSMAKTLLLAILAFMALALATWIAFGFLAPVQEWEAQFAAQRYGRSNPPD